METKMLIDRLRDKHRASLSVALRQAICYYLYNENIPCTIIAEVMGCRRRYVYKSIYRTRDYLDIGDKMTKKCMDSITEHKFRITPITVDGDILSKHVGYKLLIDNIIV